MSTAPKYIPHYTVADYQEWDGDWELWNGIPVAMTPSPFGPHQDCSLAIASSLRVLIKAEKCRAAVLQDIDWIISNDTVVRPDVLVVCGGVPEGHVTRPPALIVEILSESTAGRDRNQKRKLYEENGVNFYLIVHPNDRTIEAYQRNDQGEFEGFEPAGEWEFTICGNFRIRWDVKSQI